MEQLVSAAGGLLEMEQKNKQAVVKDFYADRLTTRRSKAARIISVMGGDTQQKSTLRDGRNVRVSS